ncbi:HEAT repeat domain-containing protein [Ideonella sp.]|uniref:HEAT repeat domain-containing protein n=1 Tax=Ideonella sp. TaxID=1929293 RepID=UPI0037C17E7B
MIRIATRGWESHKSWHAVHEIQRRGDERTLERLTHLCAHRNWRHRVVGLYAASQLRVRMRADREQFAVAHCQTLMVSLLTDSHPEVIRAAISGLGHRPSVGALVHLLPFEAHPDALVRWNLAVALGRYSQPESIEVLCRLAADPDDLVRDWATFGLGSMHEVDSPEVRNVLQRNLHDPDSDVRGEALVGLARFGDPAALNYLLHHLSPESPVYHLEAAALSAKTELRDRLVQLTDAVSQSEPKGYWHRKLANALQACSPHLRQDT